jgi:hypothetical protein
VVVSFSYVLREHCDSRRQKSSRAWVEINLKSAWLKIVEWISEWSMKVWKQAAFLTTYVS